MWVKKGQNGWNFLPRSLQPFPLISACGSRCGSSTILEDFLDEAKPPQTAVLRGFCGAAIQIRTGDLILTKDVLYHLSHSSTRVCSLICAIYPRLALQALARLQCNQQTLGDPERARTVDL